MSLLKLNILIVAILIGVLGYCHLAPKINQETASGRKSLLRIRGYITDISKNGQETVLSVQGGPVLPEIAAELASPSVMYEQIPFTYHIAGDLGTAQKKDYIVLDASCPARILPEPVQTYEPHCDLDKIATLDHFTD